MTRTKVIVQKKRKIKKKIRIIVIENTPLMNPY